jgi:hypothetical protein
VLVGLSATLSQSEDVTMSETPQVRNAMVEDVENMERSWNDAILKRDIDSAASFQGQNSS